MEDFLGLEVPAAFMRGNENGGLSYLKRLETVEATVKGIPASAQLLLLLSSVMFALAVALLLLDRDHVE